MPSRKLERPGSNKTDRQVDFKDQQTFTDVFEDIPATNLPEGAVAKAINCHLRGNTVEPRNGSREWEVVWPALRDREGYTVSVAGGLAVSGSGNIFTEDDVGNLVDFGDGYDELIEYVDAQHMRLRDAVARVATSGCRIVGKLNLWEWHSTQQRFVVQRGNQFWIARADFDSHRIYGFEEVVVISYDLPNNVSSTYTEDGDTALVQNSGGLFRIIFEDVSYAYKLNTPVMNRRPLSNEAEGEKSQKYLYVAAVARLGGSGNFRGRLDEPWVKILTESGTNVYDDTRRDWAVINTEDPIGDGVETYGVNLGAPGVGLSVVPDGTFQININGLGYKNIICDFSNCANVAAMAPVVQASLRVHFPSATCDYGGDPGNPPSFRITSGRIPGGSVSYAIAGLGGTDVATILGLTAAAGAVLSYPYVGLPHTLYGLYLPVVVSAVPQWHWTHFVLYRSANVGPYGLLNEDKTSNPLYSHINVRGVATANSPDALIWEKDLRVCGSFLARRVNGIVEIALGEQGQFESEDELNAIEFEDGSRVTIISNGYIDEKHAFYSGLVGANYGGNTDWMAANLGNARSLRVTQTGNIVSRVAGSSAVSHGGWTAADERKPVWWPNGYQSFIKRVIDADTVEVFDDIDRPETGLAVDPTYRNYTDRINDETLFAHAGTEVAGWTCKGRFLQPIPPGNMVIKQPGFFMFAALGGKDYWYCQLESSYRQYVGYYHPNYQKHSVEDRVMAMHAFKNRFALLCQGSIHVGATNNSTAISIAATGQQVYSVSGLDKVSDRGLGHRGGIANIGEDVIRFVTNTNEIVDFDGAQIMDSISDDKTTGYGRMRKALKAAHPEFASIATQDSGYMLWWKRK